VFHELQLGQDCLRGCHRDLGGIFLNGEGYDFVVVSDDHVSLWKNVSGGNIESKKLWVMNLRARASKNRGCIEYKADGGCECASIVGEEADLCERGESGR
jgi:hypothetical protein